MLPLWFLSLERSEAASCKSTSGKHSQRMAHMGIMTTLPDILDDWSNSSSAVPSMLWCQKEQTAPACWIRNNRDMPQVVKLHTFDTMTIGEAVLV